MSRPSNILFITGDQFHPDFVGAFGKYPVRTPNLDRLCTESAVHTQAYSTNPLCMPARCSLLTGLYSHQHGINDNRGDLSPLLATLPNRLRAAGYRTALIGKIHFFEAIPSQLDYTRLYGIADRLGFDDAWLTGGKTMIGYVDDEWSAHLSQRNLLDRYRRDLDTRAAGDDSRATFLSEEDTVDFLTMQKAIEYFTARAGEPEPFYLWLSFCNPHPRFDPLAGILETYNGVMFPPPPAPPADFDQPSFQKKARAYASLITQLDGYIGRVVDELDKTGMGDDTLVVFCADHGELLGAHGYEGKTPPFDGSARVPFLARCPKLIEPRRNERPIEITDTAATFLELAGITDVQTALPESPSQSLLPVWRGGNGKTRRFAFYESGYQFSAPYMALCDGKWKYVFYSFTGEELLFDIVQDPEEVNDLSSTRFDLLPEMRHALLKRLGATPSPIPGFWAHEEITGEPSPEHHHGPPVRNTGLTDL